MKSEPYASRIYPLVRDYGFGLWFQFCFHASTKQIWQDDRTSLFTWYDYENIASQVKLASRGREGYNFRRRPVAFPPFFNPFHPHLQAGAKV